MGTHEFEYLQAYLSLPEGTASVIGLTAMMCDYYSMLVRLNFIFWLAGCTFPLNLRNSIGSLV